MELGAIISLEARQFIEKHENTDLSKLLLAAGKYEGLNVRELVDQIKSKRKAKAKLPEWYSTAGIVFPPPISLEQSSSAVTAKYKASLLNAGQHLLDLTGGMGIDTVSFSKKFEQVSYVERHEFLVKCFKHNVGAFGINNITAHVGDALEYLKSMEEDQVDVIYLDPARRDQHKNKVVAIEDCEPNLTSLLPALFQKTNTILVKFSPMLDIHYVIMSLGGIKEVHVVAVDNECKELLLKIEKGFSKEPLVTTINISNAGQQVFSFYTSSEKRLKVSYSVLENYLYEPNAALMKAGAFKTIASQFSLKKLSEHTHLYTSDKLIQNFPGKIYTVQRSYSPGRKNVLANLRGKKVSVKTRNYPDSAQSIRKKFKLLEGDETHAFFCRVLDRLVVIEATKLVKES